MRIDDKQICFVTTTQYQLMIADIYARYIYDKYKIKSIVINRTFKNFDTKKFDTNDKYQLIPYSIYNKTVIGKCLFALRCGYLYRFSKWQKILEPNKRIVLFVFNDMSKLANRFMYQTKEYSTKNKIYIIEEGNSTYSDNIDLKSEKLWKLKHRISKLLFGYGRISKVIGESVLIDGAIVSDTKRYSKLKKSKKQIVIQQNQDILQFASEFYEHYISLTEKSIKADIIYLGQPFFKNGRYFKYENKCIDAIISAISPDAKVMIKPHPRDSIGKYKNIVAKHGNVSLISKDLMAIPIEALLGLLQTKVIITIQSSAAITLADLYPDIYSIVMKNTPQAKILFKKLKEKGDEGPVFGNEIFAGKNNNIFLPETIDESIMLVNKMRRTMVKEQGKQETTPKQFPELESVLTAMEG